MGEYVTACATGRTSLLATHAHDEQRMGIHERGQPVPAAGATILLPKEIKSERPP